MFLVTAFLDDVFKPVTGSRYRTEKYALESFEREKARGSQFHVDLWFFNTVKWERLESNHKRNFVPPTWWTSRAERNK